MIEGGGTEEGQRMDKIGAEPEQRGPTSGSLDHHSDDKNRSNNPRRQNSASGDASSVPERGGNSSAEGSRLDEDAAVGSIHHILKTAFKELYAVPARKGDDSGVSEPPDTTKTPPASRPSSGADAEVGPMGL